MRNGFAGYSLIEESNPNGSSTVGHAIFCPNCATEIATVNVSFLPSEAPNPGSRMSILEDIARQTFAASHTEVIRVAKR